MSNPSSRPRSQLGGTQNQTQNLIMVGGSAGNNTSNYASLMATAQTQGIATNPTNGPLKYKFVNSTTNSSGTQQQNINNNHQLSRNVQINKIKDFFIHHTYSANLNGTGGGGINGGGIMSQSMCGPQATVSLFLMKLVLAIPHAFISEQLCANSATAWLTARSKKDRNAIQANH